ncbi:hypothetical protein J6590_047673 [Homalodisca vitripennis]|nr:hypothetical protein J6590_047673 [Homalodisca vitripennis]
MAGDLRENRPKFAGSSLKLGHLLHSLGIATLTHSTLSRSRTPIAGGRKYFWTRLVARGSDRDSEFDNYRSRLPIRSAGTTYRKRLYRGAPDGVREREGWAGGGWQSWTVSE